MPLVSQKDESFEAILLNGLNFMFISFVGQYEHMILIHIERDYVIYGVLADLVPTGCRPSVGQLPGSGL